MSKVFVSGLINLETTLKVEGFPIHYSPVRYPFFGVRSTVSGVGYNIARALTILGDQVAFASIIGKDSIGKLVLQTFQADSIDCSLVLPMLEQTPQSVILYDPSGKRQINVDLKDIQDHIYPPDHPSPVVEDCDLAVLCNINFSRPILRKARSAGKWIATDIHAISSLEDDYNRDFMISADILFMSDEALPEPPESWAQRILDRYANEVIVIGLGARGALLSVKRDHYMGHYPVVPTRPVVSTIGAGDALFSSFIHFYLKLKNPYRALAKAMTFASYKIGTAGAAEGLLTEEQLERVEEGNFTL